MNTDMQVASDISIPLEAGRSYPAMGYMPQLDGLRALAVLTVLIQHWGGSHLNVSGIPIGGFGVGLFFVLSGYLITGILLENKSNSRGENATNLKRFWARRVLRIFPVFYAAIALGCLFKIPGVSDHWVWHVPYLTNVRLYFLDDGRSLGYATHFWTLAIEEQFYMFWPMVILFAPNRTIPILVALAIMTAPVWRAVHSSFLIPHSSVSWALLPNQLDYLGMGALMAVFRGSGRLKAKHFSIIAVTVGALGFAICHFGNCFGSIKQTFVSLNFCGIIIAASSGIRGPIGRFLESRPMTFLGRISYGIYVFHMFAPFFWNYFFYSFPIPGYRIMYRFGIPETVYEHPLFLIVMYSIFTLTTATVSFFGMESPLMKLKPCFPYVRARTLSTLG